MSQQRAQSIYLSVKRNVRERIEAWVSETHSILIHAAPCTSPKPSHSPPTLSQLAYRTRHVSPSVVYILPHVSPAAATRGGMYKSYIGCVGDLQACSSCLPSSSRLFQRILNPRASRATAGKSRTHQLYSLHLRRERGIHRVAKALCRKVWGTHKYGDPHPYFHVTFGTLS